MKGLQQGIAAQVSDEYRAAWPQAFYRAFQDSEEMLEVRKMLDDRIDHHNVKSFLLPDCFQFMRRLAFQDDLGHVQFRTQQLLPHKIQFHRRYVCSQVQRALGRNPEEQHTSAAADLPNSLRLQGRNALDRCLQPLAHLVGGNWLSCIAAIPSGNVKRDV